MPDEVQYLISEQQDRFEAVLNGQKIGEITFVVSEVTNFWNAPPIITPTAKSNTFPLNANSLNSFNILSQLLMYKIYAKSTKMSIKLLEFELLLKLVGSSFFLLKILRIGLKNDKIYW